MSSITISSRRMPLVARSLECAQALSLCHWYRLPFHIKAVQRRRHVMKSDAYQKVEEYHCGNGLEVRCLGSSSWARTKSGFIFISASDFRLHSTSTFNNKLCRVSYYIYSKSNRYTLCILPPRTSVIALSLINASTPRVGCL